MIYHFYLWLLAIVSTMSISSCQYTPSGIFGDAVPKEEALAYFNALFDDDVTGESAEKHFNVPTNSTRTYDTHHTTAIKRQQGTDISNSMRSNFGKTLEDLSNGMLSDSQFTGADWDSYTCLTATSVGSFTIPATATSTEDKVYTRDDDKLKDLIICKKHNAQAPDMLTVEIEIRGVIKNFMKIQNLNVNVHMKKDFDTDVFSIIELDVMGQVTDIVSEVIAVREKINKVLDQRKDQLNLAVLDTILQNANKVFAFGAFNTGICQYVIGFDLKGTTGSKLSSIMLIINIRAGRQAKEYTLAITAPNIIKEFVGSFKTMQKSVESNSLLKDILNTIKNDACAFINQAEQVFLDPIKGNTALTPCFGDQSKAEYVEQFSTVPKGLHLLLTVNYTELLVKHCELESTDISDISDVSIYASITNGAFTLNFVEKLDIPAKVIYKCIAKGAQTIPAYITDGKFRIKSFDIINKKNWTVGVQLINITLPYPEDHLLELLDLEVTRKGQGGGTRWSIKGVAAVKVGSTDADMSLSKKGRDYNLQVKSDYISLGDILKFLPSQKIKQFVSDEGAISKLGINDFMLTFTNIKKTKVFTISGTPFIAGYTGLSIVGFYSIDGQSNKYYSIAIYLNSANFDPIMKNIFGIDSSLQWLSELKGIVVITNTNNKLANAPPAKAKKQKKGNKKKTPGVSLIKRQSVPAVKYEKNSGNIIIIFPTLHQTFIERLNPSAADGNTKVTFGLLWNIPKQKDKCLGNLVCEWMVHYLSDTSASEALRETSTTQDADAQDAGAAFMIHGSVSKNKFTLTALLKVMIKLYDGGETNKLHFTELSLYLEVGTALPKFKLTVKLAYLNTNIATTILTFSGTIEATPLTISLVLRMDGFIYPSAITNYLAIGDLHVKVGFTIGSVIPSFGCGATIKLGDFSKNRERADVIQITGSFGINPVRPKENWFHACIPQLAINDICMAFDMTTQCSSMPWKFRNSGFPYGIVASYSDQERKMTGIKGGVIPAGFHLKGTVNIFDYEVATDISVKKSPAQFNMTLELSPIDWAHGFIQITRSRKLMKKGPLCKINISFGDKKFEFLIQGYINLFNKMRYEIEIKINNEQIHIAFNGDLIPGFLNVDVVVDVNYGIVSGDDAGDSDLFLFQATITTTKFQQKIKQVIKDFMGNLRKKIFKFVDDLKKTGKRLKDGITAQQTTIDGWKKEVKGWRTSMDEEKKKLENEAKAQSQTCQCPKICFPFMDWKSGCWKVWGVWVGCPFWNSCFSLIEDIICAAKCAIKKVVATVVRWTKQAILSIGQWILEGVEAMLKLAIGVLELGKNVILFAENLATKAAKRICSALQAGEKWLLDKIDAIQLHMISFETKLTADYTACVSITVNITFFNKDIKENVAACLDLKSIAGAFLSLITGRHGPPETKDATKAEEDLKEFQTENDQNAKSETKYNADFKEGQRKIQEKPPASLHKRTLKRSDIPELKRYLRMFKDVPKPVKVLSEEEMETRKLIEEKIPRFDTRSDSRVRSFINKSPWGLPTHHTPLGHNATVHADLNEPAEKRSLIFGEKLNPCERMKRALDGYSDLTHGIITYSQSVQNGALQVTNRTDMHNEQLEEFRRSIENAEMEHEMDGRERDDAYELYDHLLDRHDELARKSHIAAHTEDINAMPIIRSQINSLLKPAHGTNFLKYTDLMHENAIEGYKRSTIPHPSDVKGEELLGNIKQDLQTIVTSEGSSLREITPRLHSVRKSIVAMSEYAKKCQ